MKKNFNLLLIAGVTAIMLIGCGGGGSGSDASITGIQMELNTEYVFLTGDALDPDGICTYSVRHELDSDYKVVTLTSGSARLIRG